MWFKKQEQKKFRVVLVGVNGNTTRWDVAPDDMPLVHWMATELAENRDYRATNIVAGEQLRKQAAEIEGLTREVAERREWGAKIKEEYDALEKQRARDLELKLHFMGKISLLEGKLEEASVDFEKDDALFDEAADEIERLNEELEKANALIEVLEGALGETEDQAEDLRKLSEGNTALKAKLESMTRFFELCSFKAKKGKAK